MDGVGWLARGEHELPETLEWLTPSEAARLAAMRFPKRRTEYLLRRWTGKHAVAAALGLPHDLAALARIGVPNRRGGAPYVEVDGVAAAVGVSLTDRAGWAVCLVTVPAADADGAARHGDRDPDPGDGHTVERPDADRRPAVGVDLELVEPRSDAFVADFLTATEQAFVRAAPDPDSRDAAANLVWSAKEAALKVLQVGLRADTRSVEVHVGTAEGPDGWRPVEVATALLPPGAAAGGRAGARGSVPTTGATPPAPTRRLPGWWRRDGGFVLTVTYAVAAAPPRRLPGSADLAAARPSEVWRAHPGPSPAG